VHLAQFTRAERMPSDPPLEDAMHEIRTLATLGRAARESAGIRVRQPLSRMVCVVPHAVAASVEPLLPLLAAELNVKELSLAGSADALVTLEAKANFRSLGKRFGKATPLAAQAVAGLPSETLRAFERGEPVAVSVEGESHLLVSDDVTIVRRAAGDLLVEESDGRFAAIDPTVTPELRREGIARELVSRVQRMRKEAGLLVSDRIRLVVAGEETVEEAARGHLAWIAEETLATSVDVGGPIDGLETALQVDLDGLACMIALAK
jgi:isoleucyl-tRNA synthetase